MGIKFDILSDIFLLKEASDFSKFFTSSVPVNIIHRELGVDADTQITLKPYDIRHVTWHDLRAGDAIFAVLNDSGRDIKTAKKQLLAALKKYPLPPRTSRTYNEIIFTINKLSDLISARNPAPTSKTIKYINAKLYGSETPKKIRGLQSMIHEIMPGDQEIKLAFDAFATTAVPCNRILLKRIPTEQRTNPYEKPGSRFYRVGKSEKEKIFGQEYVIWYFDDHKLLSKEHIAPGMKNAEGKEYNRFSFSFVYNMAFPGNNAYRDMYIIEDANIHNRSEHPFISSTKGESINRLNAKLDDINMHIKILQQKINEADANNDTAKKDKLLALFRQAYKTKNNIEKEIKRLTVDASLGFVKTIPITQENISDFVFEVIRKYKSKINEVISNLEQAVNSGEYQGSELTKMQQEIIDIKALINNKNVQEISRIFCDFLKDDSYIILNDFTLLHVNKPHRDTRAYTAPEYTPVDEYNKENKIDILNDMLRRIKWHIENPANDYTGVPRVRWRANNPRYENGAIAFEDIGKYNRFMRKFMQYLLLTKIKSPATAITDMISEIDF